MSQTILLIHDDPRTTTAILDALHMSSGVDFHVEWVRQCSDGVERLRRQEKDSPQAIDAVLAEMNLPDSNGIETFDRLFQAAPLVPILIISDLGNEAVARLAVRRGAQDYLLKGHLDSYLLRKALGSMIARARFFESLHPQEKLAQVTLDSIGDAVVRIDRSGSVTYLNAVAERLTGWPGAEAVGESLERVFRIIDATSREVARNPMALAMQENRIVMLTPNCLLIRRDGSEADIEDSAAPIHDPQGQVIGAVMVFRDVSAARVLSQRMSYLAQHDSLTGLPNRIVFNDRLNQAMAVADRQRDRVAVLYVDLDRFKHTNDTLGHAIGDGLLKAVADRLRSCVRASDTVSRQGGDEFVVLLPHITGVEHAEEIARKILLALRAPYSIERRELNITGSIGTAIYPDDGMNVSILLKNADIAMYQAKSSGRDNCQAYKPEVKVRAAHRAC